jgi:hypothetical protein
MTHNKGVSGSALTVIVLPLIWMRVVTVMSPAWERWSADSHSHEQLSEHRGCPG